MSDRRGRAWPSEDAIARAAERRARYCLNCWWRTVEPGDGLCSVCRRIYDVKRYRGELDVEGEPRRAPAPVELEPAAARAIESGAHPADHDCDQCEDARRRALRRAGIRLPGLGPKYEGRGEPE